MGVAQTTAKKNDAYSVEEAMNVLFSKLDEAIDDLENQRVISEEDLWEELDAV